MMILPSSLIWCYIIIEMMYQHDSSYRLRLVIIVFLINFIETNEEAHKEQTWVIPKYTTRYNDNHMLSTDNDDDIMIQQMFDELKDIKSSKGYTLSNVIMTLIWVWVPLQVTRRAGSCSKTFTTLSSRIGTSMMLKYRWAILWWWWWFAFARLAVVLFCATA